MKTCGSIAPPLLTALDGSERIIYNWHKLIRFSLYKESTLKDYGFLPLLNPKNHYHVPPLYPILSQLKRDHTLSLLLLKSI
jgi:hypothetical protein